jgi:signal transduction histidine kinase
LRFSIAADGRQLAFLVSSATGSPEATVRTIIECQDRIHLLTTELSEVKANEQERFSIGLHDEVAQPLAAARFKLALLAASLSAHERGPIASIVASLDQAIHATRSMTLQLNARMLAGPDLIVTLRELGERLMGEENIAFEFQCDAAPFQPDSDVSSTLFRAVRELLCNVAKHSGASRAKLTVAASNGSVTIGVEDNGQGFRSTDAHPGFGRPGAFGLFSIHEQLRHLGGRLEIFNVSDQGARVVVTLPLLSGTAAPV